MKDDVPNIKLFHSENKYFVYDSYSNMVLSITKKHYIELKKLCQLGLTEYLETKNGEKEYVDIVALIKKGFFKTCFIEKIEHPDTYKIQDLITSCVNYMILQVTRDCNFNCIYCQYAKSSLVERTHSHEQMPLSIAQKAVDFLYNHSKNANVINIGFYGGEPLLNFDLIKKTVEYSNKRFETKKTKYNVTTNGSLLTDDIINFLIDYDFSLLISLDGPEDVQNRHRRYRHNLKDTYGNVINNINKIKEISDSYFQSKVRFNPVIMPDENSEKVIDFFNSINVPLEKCNLSLANLSGVDYYYQLCYEQKNSSEIVKDYFYKKQNSDLYIRFKSKTPFSKISHHNGPCVPMLSRFFVNCYGDIFCCEKIIESTSAKLGNVTDETVDLNKIESLLNIGRLTQNQCKKCYAIRLCSLCAISCFDPENHTLSSNQKLEHCKRMKKDVDDFLLNYAKERTKSNE